MRVLYKFQPPHRLLAFLNRPQIRFTPPEEFNDPFDCLMSSEVLDHPERIEQMWQAMQPDLQVSLALAAATGKTELPTLKLLRQHFDRYRKQFMPYYKKAAMMLGPGDGFGIFCVTEVRPDHEDATLTWGHYGDSHKGFAIGFDLEHPFFAKMADGSDKSCVAGPVTYTAERPKWVPDKEFAKVLVFTKAKKWIYESEERFVRLIGLPSMLPDGKGKPTLMDIPAECVVSLTLGTKAEFRLRRQAFEAVKAGPLHHLVPDGLYQGEPSVSRYRIEMVKFDPEVHLVEDYSGAMIAKVMRGQLAPTSAGGHGI